MTDCKFECDEINKFLVGGTIASSLITEDKQSFGFVVRQPNGNKYQVWIDCDPEGNGPGHVSIEPVVESKGKSCRKSGS